MSRKIDMFRLICLLGFWAVFAIVWFVVGRHGVMDFLIVTGTFAFIAPGWMLLTLLAHGQSINVDDPKMMALAGLLSALFWIFPAAHFERWLAACRAGLISLSSECRRHGTHAPAARVPAVISGIRRVLARGEDNS